MIERKLLGTSGLSVAFMLGLSACATGPCDAQSDPGFFANAGCQLQGKYYEQTESLKLELSEAKAINAQLAEVLKAIDAEALEVRAEAKAQNFEYAKLNKAMGPLLASLEAQKAESASLQEDIDEVRAELTALNNGTGASTFEKQQQLNNLRAKMVLLQDELGLTEEEIGV